MTTDCGLYSNISQILLLYKTWGYHNEFESTKSLRVYNWYVKIPQCGYMEHGLKYTCIATYVQKPIAPSAILYNLQPLGAPAFMRLVYCDRWISYTTHRIYISMGYCKKDVTPLLTHWSYVFLALTHRYGLVVCFVAVTSIVSTGFMVLIYPYSSR